MFRNKPSLRYQSCIFGWRAQKYQSTLRVVRLIIKTSLFAVVRVPKRFYTKIHSHTHTQAHMFKRVFRGVKMPVSSRVKGTVGPVLASRVRPNGQRPTLTILDASGLCHIRQPRLLFYVFSRKFGTHRAFARVPTIKRSNENTDNSR